MQTTVIMGLPVLIILLVVLQLKLNRFFIYILIAGLGIGSSLSMEFIFCSILKTQCAPDPLNQLGLMLHSFYVTVISWVIYTIFLLFLEKEKM